MMNDKAGGGKCNPTIGRRMHTLSRLVRERLVRAGMAAILLVGLMMVQTPSLALRQGGTAYANNRASLGVSSVAEARGRNSQTLCCVMHFHTDTEDYPANDSCDPAASEDCPKPCCSGTLFARLSSPVGLSDEMPMNGTFIPSSMRYPVQEPNSIFHPPRS
jgi:hypothetical protein